MAKFNQNNAALRICVDAVRDGRLSGLIFSQRLKAPLPFSDAAQLLLQIEALLDAQNFPQAFQRKRAFRLKAADVQLAADSPEDGLSAQEIAAAAGAVRTITVYVDSRRSSSWQGRINWEDGTPQEQFSSALVFMRLLGERVTIEARA